MPLPNFLQIGQDIASRLLNLENGLTTANENLTDYKNEVITALTELIQENGGTVPTDINPVQAASVQPESTDEFAEYDDE